MALYKSINCSLVRPFLLNFIPFIRLDSGAQKYNNSLLCAINLDDMDWQKILVIVLMALAIVYLVKKFRKPKDNCGRNCQCS
mgnify:CR=1 FL=1